MTINSSGLTTSGIGSLIAGMSTQRGPGQISVGADGTILTSDSSQLTGYSWQDVFPTSLKSFAATNFVYGSTGTGTASYGSTDYFYGEVGNLVICLMKISYTSFTGTGNLQVALPVTVGASQVTPAVGPLLFDGTYTGSGTRIILVASSGNGFATMSVFDNGVTPVTQQCSDATFGDIFATLVYLIN